MSFRKFSADYLFDGYEMVAGRPVLVTTEDGLVRDLVPEADAGEDIERLNGVLSPGFVNCHCHLELSHMKGALPEGDGLVDFLLAVISRRNSPAGGSETAEQRHTRVLQAIADAELSMLDNGIVGVGDICNTVDTIAQKTQGNLFYHNFIETMGFLPAAAPQRMAGAIGTFNQFAEAYGLPIAANSLVPHAPYSVSAELFGLIANFPGNQLLTIHNQENEAENQFLFEGKGDFVRLYQAMGLDISFYSGRQASGLSNWLPHFYRNQSLLLVHDVATKAADLQWLSQWTKDAPTLSFCLCPNANLYISRQLPDVPLLARSGYTMVVGTDSLASNHQLSILEEIKTLQLHFPEIGTPTLLKWATSNGAEVLQMDSALGSFKKGKQPGILLLEGCREGRLTPESRVKRLL